MNYGFYTFPVPALPKAPYSPGLDHARGRTVTANVGITNVANITDGSDATASGAQTTTYPQNFTIDLGTPQLVRRCRVLWAGGVPTQGAKSGAVQYSQDNTNWNTVATWTDNTLVEMVFDFQVVARYWRLNGIVGYSGTGMAIASWNLYG